MFEKEMVTISREEYKRLIKNSIWLHTLREAGVDSVVITTIKVEIDVATGLNEGITVFTDRYSGDTNLGNFCSPLWDVQEAIRSV